MSRECRRWEGWIAAGAPDAGDEAHLQSCPTCGEQWRAHRSLAALGEIELPPLAPDLGLRIATAVAGEGRASPLTPRQLRLMRLYWLFSTLGAGVILSQLGPATGAWPLFWAAVGALALAGLPIFVLLQRRCSWGLMDLVVWTFR